MRERNNGQKRLSVHFQPSRHSRAGLFKPGAWISVADRIGLYVGKTMYCLTTTWSTSIRLHRYVVRETQSG